MDDDEKREEILGWIRARAAQTGYVPITAEYGVKLGAPTGLRRVQVIFGNWGNACEAAGLPRVERGRRIYVGRNGDAAPDAEPEPAAEPAPAAAGPEETEAEIEPLAAADAAVACVGPPDPLSLSDLARRLELAHRRVDEARSRLALAEEQALETAREILAHASLTPYTSAP